MACFICYLFYKHFARIKDVFQQKLYLPRFSIKIKTPTVSLFYYLKTISYKDIEEADRFDRNRRYKNILLVFTL